MPFPIDPNDLLGMREAVADRGSPSDAALGHPVARKSGSSFGGPPRHRPLLPRAYFLARRYARMVMRTSSNSLGHGRP